MQEHLKKEEPKVERPLTANTATTDTTENTLISEREPQRPSNVSPRRSIKLAAVAHACKWLVSRKETNVFLEKLKSAKNLTWYDIIGPDILSEHNVQFALHFNDNIFRIITGTKLMELTGCEIPEKIRYTAMERDRLRLDKHYVSQMVNSYNDIIKDLTIPQVMLSSEFI